MAQVFRVERNKNFTVMSNHHFKNKDLSLKAKGLLSLMLSLPEDWNYNMQGLASLSRDGIDSVRSAMGYVTVVLFAIIQNGTFQNDSIDFFRIPFMWYIRFGEWVVYHDL